MSPTSLLCWKLKQIQSNEKAKNFSGYKKLMVNQLRVSVLKEKSLYNHVSGYDNSSESYNAP